MFAQEVKILLKIIVLVVSVLLTVYYLGELRLPNATSAKTLNSIPLRKSPRIRKLLQEILLFVLELED